VAGRGHAHADLAQLLRADDHELVAPGDRRHRIEVHHQPRAVGRVRIALDVDARALGELLLRAEAAEADGALQVLTEFREHPRRLQRGRDPRAIILGAGADDDAVDVRGHVHHLVAAAGEVAPDIHRFALLAPRIAHQAHARSGHLRDLQRLRRDRPLHREAIIHPHQPHRAAGVELMELPGVALVHAPDQEQLALHVMQREIGRRGVIHVDRLGLDARGGRRLRVRDRDALDRAPIAGEDVHARGLVAPEVEREALEGDVLQPEHLHLVGYVLSGAALGLGGREAVADLAAEHLQVAVDRFG